MQMQLANSVQRENQLKRMINKWLETTEIRRSTAEITTLTLFSVPFYLSLKPCNHLNPIKVKYGYLQPVISVLYTKMVEADVMPDL